MPRAPISNMDPFAINCFVFCYEAASLIAEYARDDWNGKLEKAAPFDWRSKNETMYDIVSNKIYDNELLKEFASLLEAAFPYGTLNSQRFSTWMEKYYTEWYKQYEEGLTNMSELIGLIYEDLKKEKEKLDKLSKTE